MGREGRTEGGRKIAKKNSRNDFLIPAACIRSSTFNRSYITMWLTGSLQSLWPVLPPIARACTE
jgi:hypothetical protein